MSVSEGCCTVSCSVQENASLKPRSLWKCDDVCRPSRPNPHQCLRLWRVGMQPLTHHIPPSAWPEGLHLELGFNVLLGQGTGSWDKARRQAEDLWLWQAEILHRNINLLSNWNSAYERKRNREGRQQQRHKETGRQKHRWSPTAWKCELM